MNTAHSPSTLMPVLFVPHGGGPMPLLDEPNHRELTHYLQTAMADIPRPKAILMISAHWESKVASISSGTAPAMIFDYSGFPPESYRLNYPAPGEPALANTVLDLLQNQGISAQLDAKRGYDHGTFVPLMLMAPAADIPVVQLSLLNSLDPAAHIALGQALAPLREQGVLIVGSGMSFHNMRAFFSGDPAAKGRSEAFDNWLSETMLDADLNPAQRQQRLENWSSAPEARYSHPREEHLLPLHVCFGAATVSSNAAVKSFSGLLFGTQISGFRWD